MKATRQTVIVVAALAASIATSPVLSQENYTTAWSGHKYVIVNSSLAGTSSSVTRFPLLVRLDSTHATVFTQSKADGTDLRFTKTNNVTRLPHQIESWNPTARTAAIWVLADTIPSGRVNHAFRMHWGNASAADSSSGAKVFDTAAAFQAVWHMAGTANEADATVNGFVATQNGTPPQVAVAAVGAGRTVSSGNYFRANGSASGKLNFPEGGNYTISAWVLANTMTAHGTVVSKHDNAYALKLNGDATSWEFFEFGTSATNAGWNWVNASAFEDLGVWKHLVGVHTGTEVMLYVNGQRMDGGFATATSTAARVEARDVTLGAQPAGSNTAVQRPFDGVLDEVRMSNVARDESWILLEYQTQKAGGSVVRVLDTIPVSLRPSVSGRAEFVARSHGGGLLFRVDAAGAVKARVEIVSPAGTTIFDRVQDAVGGDLIWDGRDHSGRLASRGVYGVRIRLYDARGKAVSTLEKRVSFTR